MVATAPIAGGDISTATRLRLSNGTTALMKTLPHAPDGFFAAGRPGCGGWPRRPRTAASPCRGARRRRQCVILRWVEPKSSVDVATALEPRGSPRRRSRCAGFGLDSDGFIGRLPLPNKPAETWAEFYAVRRLLPYLRLARDRGAAATPGQAATVEAVVPRLAELVPEPRPACTATCGTATCCGAWTAGLADRPGGVRRAPRVDLAMLALFGLPHLPQVLDAYAEATPLADGWADRVGCTSCSRCSCTPATSAAATPRATDIASRYV